MDVCSISKIEKLGEGLVVRNRSLLGLLGGALLLGSVLASAINTDPV